jgi:hypothetical protein
MCLTQESIQAIHAAAGERVQASRLAEGARLPELAEAFQFFLDKQLPGAAGPAPSPPTPGEVLVVFLHRLFQGVEDAPPTIEEVETLAGLVDPIAVCSTQRPVERLIALTALPIQRWAMPSGLPTPRLTSRLLGLHWPQSLEVIRRLIRRSIRPLLFCRFIRGPLGSQGGFGEVMEQEPGIELVILFGLTQGCCCQWCRTGELSRPVRPRRATRNSEHGCSHHSLVRWLVDESDEVPLEEYVHRACVDRLYYPWRQGELDF